MRSFVGAAFLRGINVGGRTVTNDRLRQLFEELDFSDVVPFLASGNVIFSTDSSSPGELVDAIESHLEDRLGFDVAAFVRSREEIVDIANHDPFDLLPEGKVHVGFLDEEPDRSVQDEVGDLCQDGDRVRFLGREMFWHVTGPFMGSALSGPAVGKVFGNRLTVRTAKTVERLAAKLPPRDIGG